MELLIRGKFWVYLLETLLSCLPQRLHHLTCLPAKYKGSNLFTSWPTSVLLKTRVFSLSTGSPCRVPSPSLARSVLFRTRSQMTSCSYFSLPRLLSPSATAVTQERGVKAAVLTLCTSEAPGGLLQHRLLGPTPTVSDSVGL